MGRYHKWSKNETELLKKLYSTVRVKDLIKQFPYRTKDTIVAKALNLGLISAKLWQPFENQILFRYFADMSRGEILDLLPKRSWAAIIAQGERLGLKRKIDKPRLSVNEDYFKQWTFNMAYILGFIFADGCIIKGTYPGYSDSLKFGVQLCDNDILNKIKSELKAEHKISKRRNAAYFSLASQTIVDDLKSLNIAYRKSLHEKLPEIPEVYKRDFIRGIIDGDGGNWIDKKGYPNLIVCGGKEVVTFVEDYLYKTLQVYSSFSRVTYVSGVLYQIRYRCNSAMSILDHIYNNADLYLDRKYNLAQACLKLKIRKNRNRNDLRELNRGNNRGILS